MTAPRWPGALLLALAATPAAAQPPADAATVRAFAIPAQPLADAVLAFSEQGGVQLVVAAGITAGVRGNAVAGRLPVGAALDRLLAGSGLRWRFLGPHTITIERVAGAAPGGARTFAPVVIDGARDRRPLNARGSTDATATEGSGSLAARQARVGGKAAARILDAPRSVSALTADRLVQQRLIDTNDAVAALPGVAARRINGAAGYALIARGYPLTTLTFDGGGPISYQFDTDADVRSLADTPELAEFDHVEVLRGGAGAFGGFADPAGVVNFQRKRPLDHARLGLDAQLGSWGNRRLEADASVPLGFAGRLRARAVGVVQQRRFFYDIADERRAFGYGIVEAEPTDTLSLRAGGSDRDLAQRGFDASGLPRYGDGGDTRLSRRTCLCVASDRLDLTQRERFAIAEWQPGGGWRVTANVMRRVQRTRFDAGILVLSADRDGSAVAVPRRSSADARLAQLSADLALAGTVAIGGWRIDLTAGADLYVARSRTATTLRVFPLVDTTLDADFTDLLRAISPGGDDVPTAALGQRTTTRQYAPYVAATVGVSPRFAVDLGLRVPFYDAVDRTPTAGVFRPGLDGAGRGVPVAPNVALRYRPTDDTRLYASYQRTVRYRLARREPVAARSLGQTYEVGLKWEPPAGDRRLSAALYYQPVRGLAVPQDSLDGVALPPAAYRSVHSYGADVEYAGRIGAGWDVQAAYGWNRSRYRFAGRSYRWQPQQPAHQFRLWAVREWRAGDGRWQAGGGIRWNGATFADGGCDSVVSLATLCLTGLLYDPDRRIRQRPYAVADLRVARRFADDLEIALNITNLTDTRYYASLNGIGVGNYYGEPRAATVSLRKGFE